MLASMTESLASCVFGAVVTYYLFDWAGYPVTAYWCAFCATPWFLYDLYHA